MFEGFDAHLSSFAFLLIAHDMPPFIDDSAEAYVQVIAQESEMLRLDLKEIELTGYMRRAMVEPLELELDAEPESIESYRHVSLSPSLREDV